MRSNPALNPAPFGRWTALKHPAAESDQVWVGDITYLKVGTIYRYLADNAFMEFFFHSMKSETIHGRTFTEDSQLLSVLRSYIPFYNCSRIHSP